MENLDVNIKNWKSLIKPPKLDIKLSDDKSFAKIIAEPLEKGYGLTILCGRFEGIDERVLDAYNFERISIGDYILSGGEVAAITMIEACVRLLPDVIGKKESLLDESFKENLLEYPQFTKPKVWVDQYENEHRVQEILLSGNHEEIKKWRKKQSILKTKIIRPDLIKKKKVEE